VEHKTKNYIITIGSLIGLLVGFIAGVLLKKSGWEVDPGLIAYFELAGNIWVILLISLVIPLAASYLIYVVISIADNSALGKMGAYSLLVHIGIFSLNSL